VQVAERTKHGSGKYRVRASAPELIKERRRALAMTQAELGRRAFNLADPTAAQVAVSRLEKGDASMVRVMDAAGALGMDLTDVVEFVPDDAKLDEA
jgi:transcriptional regulator with XRE-family HTH domain